MVIISDRTFFIIYIYIYLDIYYTKKWDLNEVTGVRCMKVTEILFLKTDDTKDADSFIKEII